jgi:hypothetical protein
VKYTVKILAYPYTLEWGVREKMSCLWKKKRDSINSGVGEASKVMQAETGSPASRAHWELGR